MGKAQRIAFAILGTPILWAVGICALYLRPEERSLGPHNPSTAPIVIQMVGYLFGWFFVLFLPLALVLLHRGKATIRNLCISGACVGAVPAAALTFFYIGMAVHGAGIVFIPALILWLVGVCKGAALGAGIAATFSILRRDKAA